MVAMSEVMYYVLPAILGRAYDLKNDTLGPDLFLASDIKNPKVISRGSTSTQYKVVSELSEANDFLDVNGKLSLKVKTGAIDVSGSGKYLKETSNFDKKVKLLINVHYNTIIETLTSDIKPLKEWEHVLAGTGMTHYVRSITYGGDLIADITFTANSAADKEIIKANVQGSMKTESGSFGAGLKGNLEKIQKKLGSSAFMDISYFATVPLTDIPKTIKGVSDLVANFPEMAKKVNNGKGIPLSMEVFSLEALNAKVPTYFQTLAFADQLMMLDEMISDVRRAKAQLGEWLKTVPTFLDSKQNEKIGIFNSKLESVDQAISKSVSEMDLSPSGSPDQFQPAFQAYFSENEAPIPGMYVKEEERLEQEILDSIKTVEADFGGATFDFWGHERCPYEFQMLYKGVMSAVDSTSVGASDFICMPDKKDFEDYETSDGSDIEDVPRIQKVVFSTRNSGMEPRKVLIPCAKCRIQGKSTVTTIPGQNECPEGLMTLYPGTLLSTSVKQARGDMFCLDTHRDYPMLDPNSVHDLTQVTEVSPVCDSFPCEHQQDGEMSIPCAVCFHVKKSNKVADHLRKRRSLFNF